MLYSVLTQPYNYCCLFTICWLAKNIYITIDHVKSSKWIHRKMYYLYGMLNAEYGISKTCNLRNCFCGKKLAELGCIHKLDPDYPGYEPAVRKLWEINVPD